MMLKLSFLFAAILLASAALGAEDKPMRSADATFNTLDRDGDGQLSKSEATGNRMLTEHFAAADADGDGFLSKQEVDEHMKQMAKQQPK